MKKWSKMKIYKTLICICVISGAIYAEEYTIYLTPIYMLAGSKKTSDYYILMQLQSDGKIASPFTATVDLSEPPPKDIINDAQSDFIDTPVINKMLESANKALLQFLTATQHPILEKNKNPTLKNLSIQYVNYDFMFPAKAMSMDIILRVTTDQLNTLKEKFMFNKLVLINLKELKTAVENKRLDAVFNNHFVIDQKFMNDLWINFQEDYRALINNTIVSLQNLNNNFAALLTTLS